MIKAATRLVVKSDTDPADIAAIRKKIKNLRMSFNSLSSDLRDGIANLAKWDTILAKNPNLIETKYQSTAEDMLRLFTEQEDNVDDALGTLTEVLETCDPSDEYSLS